MMDRRLWIGSGIAGALGVACYILAIAVPWPESQWGTSAALVAVSAWPLLSIVYSYGLCSYIGQERQSAANRLGLLFAVAAFTTVLAMIVVQLAVGAGITEITKGLDAETARAIRRGLRMVDLGLDVAWDMLIGTALICLGLAMRKRTGLGNGWGIPATGFGIALIGLNAATFPWPPADRGLFDIGPFIALFMMALAVRLAVLGRRSPRPHATAT
jgi:hypothetical protein